MDIKDIAEKIISLANEINDREAWTVAQTVLKSIQSESFHLAVLGEFKRGKSSLVNSLLEKDLLPTDVLPSTAVLNVVEYASEPKCYVTWTNGNQEEWELSQESLSRLAVGGSVNPEDVKFAILQLPSNVLKDGIVIIDTPGVNDLSFSRVEITKSILPNVDAGIFLLDAVAPVTRSEADFLTTKVLTHKLDSLLFVISKSDRLDEEELEDAVQGAETRLNEILGFTPNIITYSSYNVAKGSADGSLHQNKQVLMECIKKLQRESSLTKEERNIGRLKIALNMLENEMQVMDAIRTAQKDKVREYEEAIKLDQEGYNAKFEQLLASVNSVGRQTLLKMFSASVDHFQEKMQREFAQQVQILEGNIEKFGKTQMPIQMERLIRQFSEEKGREIYTYICKFSEHVALEYNKNFEVPFLAKMNKVGILMPNWQAQVEGSSSSTAENLINQTIPIGAGAIIGSLFFPGIGTIIGSLAGQLFGSIVKTKKNETLKNAFLAQLPILIEEVISSYYTDAEQAINKWFDEFIIQIKDHHQFQQEHLREKIEMRLDPPKFDRAINEKVLDGLKNEVLKVRQELFA